MTTKRLPSTHIVRRTVARVDASGRAIGVPTNDLNPERLALRRFSWENESERT